MLYSHTLKINILTIKTIKTEVKYKNKMVYSHCWLYILFIFRLYNQQGSPSTRGCGLKLRFRCTIPWAKCHPPREGVDWNSCGYDGYVQLTGHPPREGVDWNLAEAKKSWQSAVTLHARVWIETCYFRSNTSPTQVTLHARVWIETSICAPLVAAYSGHPPREGVDWNKSYSTVPALRWVTLHARVWIETAS